MKSKIERVHINFADELDKMWKQRNREVTKVDITRQIADQMKAMNKKNPRYIINYWPISKRKVKVY